MSDSEKTFQWKFQRVGGLDQVVLDSSDAICHLGKLDPKLWVALSCPASGLEFDERTLTLLDTDGDGRIRIPEVVAAVKWTCARLKSLDDIIQCADVLPLSAINEETETGKRLLATARAILDNLGKPEAQSLTQEDVSRSAANASERMFNGDGILPPWPALDADVRDFINDAMNVMGSVEDASGEAGIDRDIAKAFIESLTSWINWQATLDSAATPLRDNTAEAWELIQALKEKINDYFLRSELASYAPQAEIALNVNEEFLVPQEHGMLDHDALSALPLSKIRSDKPLNLKSGLNPAWRSKMERLAELIKDLLADPQYLTRKEWQNLEAVMKPYSDAVSSKPALVEVKTTNVPQSSIDSLGESRINEILASDAFDKFSALADKDSKIPAAAPDIADVERLVLFHKHLYRLLVNFVSFHDFYDMDRSAAFQSGVLYIDGRACHLCVPVEDVEQHAKLASYTELYLLYCECWRKKDPPEEGVETRKIVAAVTAGSADLLLENRNGVFVDNQGNDWDATVIKVITKPISLWQAVWDPYKRFARMVTEQINKWASSKDSALMTTGTQKIQEIAAASTTPPATAAASKFDIGKNVGILAAIGLAIGAIGTALASIARSLFTMEWWQFPLVILGIFILVSGPSVVIAWLKLRQRTLGPLLEASGWAVNGRVFINYTLGNELTCTAELPENAKRSYSDPIKKKPKTHIRTLVFLVAVLVGVAAFYFFRQ